MEEIRAVSSARQSCYHFNFVGLNLGLAIISSGLWIFIYEVIVVVVFVLFYKIIKSSTLCRPSNTRPENPVHNTKSSTKLKSVKTNWAVTNTV